MSLNTSALQHIMYHICILSHLLLDQGVVPKRPFKHPDASFLPLPEEVGGKFLKSPDVKGWFLPEIQAPQPRLFVVYGDGEVQLNASISCEDT